MYGELSKFTILLLLFIKGDLTKKYKAIFTQNNKCLVMSGNYSDPKLIYEFEVYVVSGNAELLEAQNLTKELSIEFFNS